MALMCATCPSTRRGVHAADSLGTEHYNGHCLLQKSTEAHSSLAPGLAIWYRSDSFAACLSTCRLCWLHNERYRTSPAYHPIPEPHTCLLSFLSIGIEKCEMPLAADEDEIEHLSAASNRRTEDIENNPKTNKCSTPAISCCHMSLQS